MRAIDKRFSGVPALAGASLEVAPGEVHALVGQNGAGKSTLIKILTGAYRKDGGEIRFEDRPIEFTSPQAAQRGGISTIYQEINLIPYRSVAENVFLGREPRRLGFLDWERMNAAATRLLHRFQIDVDVRRPLLDFNTAIQQMVAIARAVSFEARLVIMDEPTSSLDEREAEVLFDVIRELKRDGVSVVLVSHRLDELYAVCDRVTVMRDGRTVLVAEMAAISKLQLVAAMLGRDLAQVRAEGATAFHNPGHHGGAELLRAEHLAAGRRVHDASLAVRAGEIVGLAGLLGSGRSEVARAVFGADRVDGGTIEVDGQPASFAQPADAIARGLGYCSGGSQGRGHRPRHVGAREPDPGAAAAPGQGGIVDETRQREVVERLIRRLGVRCASPEQRIRELSGGNQQKVLLARWLCMNPRLLILDEPTRGIDVGGKAEIQTLIKELADQGLGVLMISSELEEIVEGCDRVFVLRDGRTVAELSHAELSELAVMTAMAHGDGAAEHAGG